MIIPILLFSSFCYYYYYYEESTARLALEVYEHRLTSCDPRSLHLDNALTNSLSHFPPICIQDLCKILAIPSRQAFCKGSSKDNISRNSSSLIRSFGTVPKAPMITSIIYILCCLIVAFILLFLNFTLIPQIFILVVSRDVSL